MSKSKKSSVESLFYNNKFLMVFSVLVAIVFWATVKVNYSADTTKTLHPTNITFNQEDYTAYYDIKYKSLFFFSCHAPVLLFMAVYSIRTEDRRQYPLKRCRRFRVSEVLRRSAERNYRRLSCYCPQSAGERPSLPQLCGFCRRCPSILSS